MLVLLKLCFTQCKHSKSYKHDASDGNERMHMEGHDVNVHFSSFISENNAQTTKNCNV